MLGSVRFVFFQKHDSKKACKRKRSYEPPWGNLLNSGSAKFITQNYGERAKVGQGGGRSAYRRIGKSQPGLRGPSDPPIDNLKPGPGDLRTELANKNTIFAQIFF